MKQKQSQIGFQNNIKNVDKKWKITGIVLNKNKNKKNSKNKKRVK